MDLSNTGFSPCALSAIAVLNQKDLYNSLNGIIDSAVTRVLPSDKGHSKIRAQAKDIMTGQFFGTLFKDDDGPNQVGALTHLIGGDGLPVELFKQDFHRKLIDVLKENAQHNNPLPNDETLRGFLRSLAYVREKGIGSGEVLLTLLSNGIVRNPGRIDLTLKFDEPESADVKDGAGASMKPTLIKTNLIDELCKELFDGYSPTRQGEFEKWRQVATLDRVGEWFHRLYSDAPTAELQEHAATIFGASSLSDLHRAHGLFCFRQYKRIEGFHSLILITVGKDEEIWITNVIDPDQDYLEYKAKLHRGSDTQAVPDGYANISINKKTIKSVGSKQ